MVLLRMVEQSGHWGAALTPVTVVADTMARQWRSGSSGSHADFGSGWYSARVQPCWGPMEPH